MRFIFIEHLIFGLCALLLLQEGSSESFADDLSLVPQGQIEIRKAVESLQPRPSLDITPIEFSIADVHYHVPRNYIITMDNWSGGPQGIVTFSVNLPDLKPLSDGTKVCFLAKLSDRPPGCMPFKFILGPIGAASAEQIFERSRDLFHSQQPLPGPSGFEKFETGPEDARIEDYRKVEDGRTILYRCLMGGYPDRRNEGQCSPQADTTIAGAAIQFWFLFSQFDQIAEIDPRLRHLVESFTVSTGEH